MELKDILALMDRFDASAATGLTVTEGDFTLSLEKATAPVAAIAAPIAPVAPAPAGAAVAATAGASGRDLIKAPLVGTFYAAPSPDKAAFAPVGATVKKGQTVCVLEAMKMMSEVPAPADCVVEEVLVADGELVGFDSPLFRVRFL